MFAQVGLKGFYWLNKPSIDCQRVKNLPKWQYFTKFDHTATYPPTKVDGEKVINWDQECERLGWPQCDQIELFLKVLGDKFSYKSSPNAKWLLGNYKTLLFM